MGTFRALVRQEVVALADLPLRAVRTADASLWRQAFASLAGLRPEPEDSSVGPDEIVIRSWDGEAHLFPHVVPEPRRLTAALRELVLARAAYKVRTREDRCSTFFRIYGEDELRSIVAESDAWDMFINGVINSITPPDELFFMDGGFDVTTNWIEREAMESLLEDEASEHLLEKLEAGPMPVVAVDYASVLRLFERALAEGHELHYLEFGT